MNQNKILIFSGGNFPFGAWPNRTRLWVKGFNNLGYNAEIIVMFPPLPKSNHDQAEDFVIFLHKPLKEINTSYSKSISYFTGILKSFLFLIKQNNIEFVIFTGGNFILTFLFFIYCKFKKIKFKLEVADEIPFDKKKTFIRKLINFNKILFDKYIVKKVDTLFVITSYLERKFRKMHPELKIVRSSPSIVNLHEINQNQHHDLSNVSKELDKVLNSNDVKIIYAGSCARTNGLEFFFKCAKSLLDKGCLFEIILITYLGNIEKVKKFNKRINLNHKIHYFENILPKYITTCYNKSDILILPEHGNLIANAGFPSKTGELLASGKAICATNFSDLSDFLIHNKNAMISEIDDVNSYTENLEKLIIDEKLRAKLGSAAKKTAEQNFSYDKVVQIYINN